MAGRNHRFPWALCSAACLLILVLLWGDWRAVATRTDQYFSPKPAIGGAFSLQDTKGGTVTEKDLSGKPTLLFFGYTYCPDVCPTTLYEASNWLQKLGPDGDRIQIFFVTVDPQRDTRDHLASYMSAFDPRIVGLTGSAAEIDTIVAAYHAYAERTEGGDADSYLINHTASVYLLGKDGQFVDTIAYREDEAEALAKLRYLLRQG